MTYSDQLLKSISGRTSVGSGSGLRVSLLVVRGRGLLRLILRGIGQHGRDERRRRRSTRRSGMGSGCRCGASAASLSASTGNGCTGSTGSWVPLGGAAVLHLLLRRRDDVARIVDAHDSGVSARCSDRSRPSTDRRDPNQVAAGGEDRSACAAAREDEVGRDAMRVHAGHRSRRHAFPLTERNADGDDLLAARQPAASPLAARQRHGSH